MLGGTRVDWECRPCVRLRGGDEDSTTVPSRKFLFSVGPSRRSRCRHRSGVCSRVNLGGREERVWVQVETRLSSIGALLRARDYQYAGLSFKFMTSRHSAGSQESKGLVLNHDDRSPSNDEMVHQGTRPPHRHRHRLSPFWRSGCSQSSP